MKYIARIILFLMFSNLVSAQTAMKKWRDHPPYNNAHALAVSPKKIYCISDIGMFYLDRRDNSIGKMAKYKGLSDVGFSSIAYSEEYDALIIAYKSGNIDIIKNNKLINLPEIKEKQIFAEKWANSIRFMDNKALLCCGFGIVEINLEKVEFGDSYNVGGNEVNLRINDVTYDEKYIWTATDKGIFRIEKTKNGLDASNWEYQTNLEEPEANYSNIVYFANKIFTVRDGFEFNKDKIFCNENGNWKHVLPEHKNINKINISKGKMIIAMGYLDVFDENLNLIKHIYQYGEGIVTNAQMAFLDKKEDKLWIADKGNGLIEAINSWNSKIYCPNGPAYSSAIDVSGSFDQIWVASGGRWSRRGLYSFKDEKWTNLNETNDKKMKDFITVFKVKINPYNTKQLIAASLQKGIIEIMDGKVINRYDNTNSSLHRDENIDELTIQTADFDFDKDNNIWILNSATQNPIIKRTAENEWTNFPEIKIPNATSTYYNDILVHSQTNIKWIVPKGNGLWAFDETKETPLLKLTVRNSKGTLLTSNVNCIVEDLDNQLWIGTDKGVISLHSTDNIFTENKFYANYPCVDKGDNLCHHLLDLENITAMAVDGANRKWIGTSNNGVFLVSENGTKEILSFNTRNSPLPSDYIYSIAIEGKTGEVFFATENGLISYKSDASTGRSNFSETYVYPNPVRPDFEGDITITGLAENVNVKISDINGNLVYETNALGGQAVWNGKTFDGRRVNTGVYLVFCTNADGTKTFVTKLLFIN